MLYECYNVCERLLYIRTLLTASQGLNWSLFWKTIICFYHSILRRHLTCIFFTIYFTSGGLPLPTPPFPPAYDVLNKNNTSMSVTREFLFLFFFQFFPFIFFIYLAFFDDAAHHDAPALCEALRQSVRGRATNSRFP